jgi:acyl-CoA hydrolase/GNAT superfamily N-acetyltransferase
MVESDPNLWTEQAKKAHPEKFASEQEIFKHIRAGAKIFVSTACAEPQYLVRALIKYVEDHPKAFFDTEVLQVWTMGVAPYADEKFKSNFRHNSFFIGNSVRAAVNEGLADYTSIFLSEVPALIRSTLIDIDVALIQTSPPDAHGYMSLGVSVDIVKAAVEDADVVIAQVNSEMPRTHGDSFIHVDECDYLLPHNEPLLEYPTKITDDVADHLGKHVSRLIKDGDTIQVGYGSIPNAVMANLKDKRHLGVHTELLSDGIVDLIRSGVVDNTRKTVNAGKTVASFCMGSHDTYRFVHDNPAMEFRTIDYTNSPTVIAQHDNMVAINSALEIDLTGQATAESIGRTFYSGIGGQADFMRGSVRSRGGRSILAIPSTAEGGETSRIVPTLSEGAGVTLTRGDVHYVVTEYGIAYLHGKNTRERAMELITIAHPRFRPGLIQEAKRLSIIYKDQAYIPGKRGDYPEHLETFRTTEEGLTILLRPVRISDEPLLKEFFYRLSDQSMYKRFISTRRDMPHERLQEFVVIDHTQEMVILATIGNEEKETVAGVGQYGIQVDQHIAEVALVVRDDFQNLGIGQEVLTYLTLLARKQGLLGFTAEVLVENTAMLHLFEKQGFDIQKRSAEGVYELQMMFGGLV